MGKSDMRALALLKASKGLKKRPERQAPNAITQALHINYPSELVKLLTSLTTHAFYAITLD